MSRAVRGLLAGALVGFVLWAGNQRQPLPPLGEQAPAAEARDVHAASARESLRIGVFNVHRGRDAAGRASLARQIELLRTLDFDVVALNEVDGRVAGNQADDLAAALGLEALFAATERRWWHEDLGNALLTRRPVVRWSREPLPRLAGNGYRNRIRADIPWGSATLTLFVTHLDREGDAPPQLRVVAEEFLAAPKPAVLAGDFNLTRDDPQLKRLLAAEGVVDALSKGGAHDPPGRIDWLLVRGCRVVRAASQATNASDHPLVWAEVERTTE